MRGHVWRFGLLVVLLVAACAPTGGPPGTGSSTARPSGPSTPGGASGSSTPSGPTPSPATPKPPPPTPTVGTPGTEGLTITVDDGNGSVTTWTLRCDPVGGDHPDPEAACTALEQGTEALAPVPADRQCTQQFGGPQTATVVGTWQGQAVSSRFALTDGCEIARWQAREGLLPLAGA